jgi:hypothetical protein
VILRPENRNDAPARTAKAPTGIHRAKRPNLKRASALWRLDLDNHLAVAELRDRDRGSSEVDGRCLNVSGLHNLILRLHVNRKLRYYAYTSRVPPRGGLIKKHRKCSPKKNRVDSPAFSFYGCDSKCGGGLL